MTPEQERSLGGRFNRIRQEMLAGQDDALASVEVERRLELEARRGFAQAVAEARGAGHSWEQIVRHVPGLGPASGVAAAENLW